MKNKAISLLIGGSVLFGTSFIIQAQESKASPLTQASSLKPLSNTGMINAVDIQAKTIQIGVKTFGLVDGILVTSQNNQLQSQRVLAPNQRVEFELGPQPLDMKKNSPLPSQVVTTIRILSGFNEDLSKD